MRTHAERAALRDWKRTVSEVEPPRWKARVAFVVALAVFAGALYLLLLVSAVAAPWDLLEGFER